MNEIIEKEETSEALWVLTKVKESVCAVNGSYVESILLLEQAVTRLPDSDDVNVGIIHFRGEVLPVIDLRCFMGMKSHRQEQDEFEQMLELRKEDHIHWVNELKRCLEEGEPFHLATDPHMCAFGKWYDHYKPVDPTVAFHLRKIDEPHQKLHATAADAFSCSRDCQNCKREVCRQTALTRATDQYMPQVVALLEESKQIFKNSYRRMVVVISDGVTSCGVLVDEVLSAEELVDFTEVGSAEVHPLVTHVAQRRGKSGQILVMNLDRLFGQDVF